MKLDQMPEGTGGCRMESVFSSQRMPLEVVRVSTFASQDAFLSAHASLYKPIAHLLARYIPFIFLSSFVVHTSMRQCVRTTSRETPDALVLAYRRDLGRYPSLETSRFGKPLHPLCVFKRSARQSTSFGKKPSGGSRRLYMHDTPLPTAYDLSRS